MFKIEPVPFLDSGISGFLTPHAVQVHVNKHHQAYVDTANKLVPASEFNGKSMEQIIRTAQGPIFNNVAQHYNHSFFWKCLTAKKQEVPPRVASFLCNKFESVDKFKEQFVAKASTVFGSGWCYLALNKDGSVTINQYSNAANPVKDEGIPILCVDTWEHAWYIDYENRKAEYFKNFWDAVNWQFVESRLVEAKLI